MLALRYNQFGNPVTLASGAILSGFWLTQWFRNHRQDVPTTIGEVMQALISKKLQLPEVAEEYSLHQYQEAIEHSGRTGRGGKVMFLPQKIT